MNVYLAALGMMGPACSLLIGQFLSKAYHVKSFAGWGSEDMDQVAVDVVGQIKEKILDLLDKAANKKMRVVELASAIEEPYLPSDFYNAIMDLYHKGQIKLSDLEPGKYATKV